MDNRDRCGADRSAGAGRFGWRLTLLGLAMGLSACGGDSRADRLQAAFDASEGARRTVLDFGVAEGRPPYATDLPDLDGEISRSLLGGKSAHLSLGFDNELTLAFSGGELDGVSVSLSPSPNYRSGWHCRSEQALPLPEACAQPLTAKSLGSEPPAEAAVEQAPALAVGFSSSNEGAAYLAYGMSMLVGPRTALAEFHSQTGRLPVVAGDFGFQEFEEVLDAQGRVKARFSYPSVGHLRVIYSGAPMDKAELSMIVRPQERANHLRWDCKVLGVPKSWAPRQCRN